MAAKKPTATRKPKIAVQGITPFLWYDGKAQEAAEFYVSIFKDSRVTSANPMSVTFTLAGQELMALNGGPRFRFTPAVSLFVSVKTQRQMDELWARLLEGGGKPSMCGWLEDKYGLSWQVIPERLGELMGDEDEEKAGRVVQAMLKMTKIDIKGLERAYKGT
jgi:predicted 3-demethylubiquinone-9 3-methyltransferase (glyoxalase superfamily)